MRKILQFMGLSCFLLICVSCSTQPTALQAPKTVYVGPPDSLLVYPCKASPSGESVMDLAVAYSKNTGCIAMWQKQMDKIKQNKKAQEALYNVKPK